MISFLDYKNKNTTTISPVTQLDGDLVIKGNLNFLGSIDGDIESDSLAIISGQIKGEVRARDIHIKDQALINGDVKANLDVIVEKDTVIYGDVVCNNIEVKGKINGNIKADEIIVVRQGGIINGDVTCRNIVIDFGGKLEGNAYFKYNLV